MILWRWKIYPGHIIRELQAHSNIDIKTFISMHYKCLPLLDDGILIYNILDQSQPEYRYKIWEMLDCIPAIQKKKQLDFAFNPGQADIPWLPIFEDCISDKTREVLAQKEYPHVAQRDCIQFLSKRDADGYFEVLVMHEFDPYSKEYYENYFGIKSKNFITAPDVSMWIISDKQLSNAVSKELVATIYKWHTAIQLLPPPVGAKVLINECSFQLAAKKSEQKEFWPPEFVTGFSQTILRDVLSMIPAEYMSDDESKPLSESDKQKEIDKAINDLSIKLKEHYDQKNEIIEDEQPVECLHLRLDLTQARHETVIALVSLLATFSETVFPIKHIVFT